MSLDQLPINEWVVIFYPQTGAARLCPSLDFAQNVVTSASTFHKHVYKSPNDFRVRHDHAQLENSWRALHKTSSWKLPKTALGKVEDYSSEPPDVDTETFSKLFWEFLQNVGDRMSAPRMSVMVNPKENYQLRVGEMTKLANDEEAFKEKYNKQARTVFLALLNNGKEFLTEEEIKKIIYRLVADRTLKTKQEPWVIFQYYRPQFIKDGYVLRGRVPKTSRKEEDGGF